MAACSLAFDLGRDQCRSDDDCTRAGFKGATCRDTVCVPPASSVGGGAAGGAGGAPSEGGTGGTSDAAWACLGNVMTPMPPDGQPITYTFRFEYATQPNVVPAGLTVKLCASLDVDCQSPLAGLPPPDANGVVTFQEPPTFSGFLDVTSDDTMHSFAYLERPIVLPPKENLVRLIRPSEFSALVSAAHQTYDAMRGVAVVLTDDCLDERAANVSVTASNTDSETIEFYFRGNLPDLSATSTDTEGAAGFINLPVALITVDTQRGDTGTPIGEASFQSRAGIISYVFVGPTGG